MSRYEYKFVVVPSKGGFKVKSGDTFETCKEIIQKEASDGWRLKQVVVPFNEKSGVYGANCYQIIFEKEVEQEQRGRRIRFSMSSYKLAYISHEKAMIMHFYPPEISYNKVQKIPHRRGMNG